MDHRECFIQELCAADTGIGPKGLAVLDTGHKALLERLRRLDLSGNSSSVRGSLDHFREQNKQQFIEYSTDVFERRKE